MRKIDANKFYQVIEKYCNDSEDYGVSEQLKVTNKEIVEGGLKPINLSELKVWFKNIGIIGHFIEGTLFKSANYCLNSNDIKTFGNGNIQSNSIPKALKIKLSKKDKEELYQIHEEIKTRTKEVRNFINTYFDNTANCSFYDTMSLSCYAMETPQRLYMLLKN
jgi:hypothetical protein